MPLPITLKGDDAKADSPLKRITSIAMGIPRTLDSTPSASTALNLLPNNGDIGHVAGVLYFNINGNVYSFTGTLIV